MNPDLKKHLDKMHLLAMQAKSLIDAINSCIDDKNLHEICTLMVSQLAELTPALLQGLDTPERFVRPAEAKAENESPLRDLYGSYRRTSMTRCSEMCLMT